MKHLMVRWGEKAESVVTRTRSNGHKWKGKNFYLNVKNLL